MYGGGVAAGRDEQWDFFVSYARADEAWAVWVAWVLEEAGFRVLVQAWDVLPGTNWVAGMDAGVARARRTVAVLSAEYTRSMYGAAEWQAAWAADPQGTDRRLLVLRVAECERPGLLGQVMSVDLFDLSEQVARDQVVTAARRAVTGGRGKPEVPRRFRRARGRSRSG
ncbi:toll/interleukin-1 receptor domain-containing protein [Parafrankia sp. CH37]|uniref:toll/interleukin-1 receptor domain-containing protein n=1 Tax=Parafrankia sp. CH37 TaxID=683308 RepID=UPI0028A026EF|nr:toll/interleukin-1 receptor domain-containing protein [Parafrankia sp. CH37]